MDSTPIDPTSAMPYATTGQWTMPRGNSVGNPLAETITNGVVWRTDGTVDDNLMLRARINGECGD